MNILVNKIASILSEIKSNVINAFLFRIYNRRRPVKEIWKAGEEFRDKIWYDLHLYSVKNGEFDDGMVPEDIRKNAFKTAEEILNKFGEEELGPYDDFEAGILWGKLLALRWVLGADWDFCDI